MAKKVNKFIIVFKELFKGHTIDVTEVKPKKFLIKRLVEIIKIHVNDPRYENMCEYPLETMIVSAFLAILCNSSNWGEIADFTKNNYYWLSKYLSFPGKRTPIDDTYKNVFSGIDTEELVTATKKYMLSIFTRIKNKISKSINNGEKGLEYNVNAGYRLINIDGKEGRGTGRFYDVKEKKVANLQTLNVYDATDGISLFSVPIKDKTNEIPIAQEVILKLNLKNCILTLDALHAQHITFRNIMNQKGDYVIALKGNQGNAFDEVEFILKDDYLASLKKKKDSYLKLKNNKKKTYKEFYLIPFNMLIVDRKKTKDGVEKWDGARNIVVYSHIDDKTGNLEVLYFVTSLNDLETVAEAIESRWDIENLLHRHLDMSFDEDDNKTMDKAAFNNLSVMNKLALSFIKLCQPFLASRGVKRIRKSFASSPLNHLSTVLAVLDMDDIEKIFEDYMKKKKEKENDKKVN